MTWTLFASQTSPTLPTLDANLGYLGAMSITPCTAVGTNALTVTQGTNLPTQAGLVQSMCFSWICPNTNTSAATATIGTFPSLNIYKDSEAGPVVLTGGEMVAKCLVTVQYDAALNVGAGGYHMLSNPVPIGANVAALGNGFANKLRNAPLDIWQRGTAFTIATTGVSYTADGFLVGPTGASCTVSQVAGRLLTANSIKILGGASMTDTFIKQRIEGSVAGPLNSQVCTFQAYLYNSTGGAVVPTLTIKHATALDNWGATVTDVNTVSMVSCPNAAWTQIAYTFTANSVSSNGIEALVDFGAALNLGANYVQLCELDLRATPGWPSGQIPTLNYVPELRPLTIENDVNQRYLPGFNTPTTNAVNGPLGFGGAATPSTAGIVLDFYTPARIAPTSVIATGAASTFSLYSMAAAATALTSGPTYNTASLRGAFVTVQTAGASLTSNAPYYLTANTSTSNILFGGAEL